jgi:hypothetical protein
MKLTSFILSIALLASALTIFAAPAGPSADEVTGKWSLALQVPGETVDVLLDLKQDGESVTGTLTSSHASGKIGKGTYKEKKLSAVATVEIQGSPAEVQIDGTVDGDKISGSLTVQGMGSFPYTGSKSK